MDKRLRELEKEMRKLIAVKPIHDTMDPLRFQREMGEWDKKFRALEWRIIEYGMEKGMYIKKLQNWLSYLRAEELRLVMINTKELSYSLKANRNRLLRECRAEMHEIQLVIARAKGMAV